MQILVLLPDEGTFFAKVETYSVDWTLQGNSLIADCVPGSGTYKAKFNFHSYHSDYQILHWK